MLYDAAPGLNVHLANFYTPYGLAFNARGDMRISEKDKHNVWVVAANTNTLCLVAGNGSAGCALLSSNGLAQLNQPLGVAFGPDETALIADSLNHRILKVKLACAVCS
jgi:hypothetical protein